MYATPDDLLERYDQRDIGDLVADDSDPADSAVILKRDKKIFAALNDASGEIDAALMVGGRYTPAQLESLQGHGRSHLVRICCDIAMARLLGRRPRDPERLKAFSELAATWLERLRKGENVFAIPETTAAGNVEATGLSVVEYSASGLIRDRTRNYYPARPVSPYQN